MSQVAAVNANAQIRELLALSRGMCSAAGHVISRIFRLLLTFLKLISNTLEKKNKTTPVDRHDKNTEKLNWSSYTEIFRVVPDPHIANNI